MSALTDTTPGLKILLLAGHKVTLELQFKHFQVQKQKANLLFLNDGNDMHLLQLNSN